jgi:hypothetical protein
MHRSLPKGHESCLSRRFEFTPSVATDVARTFARVRERLALPPIETGRRQIAMQRYFTSR